MVRTFLAISLLASGLIAQSPSESGLRASDRELQQIVERVESLLEGLDEESRAEVLARLRARAATPENHLAGRQPESAIVDPPTEPSALAGSEPKAPEAAPQPDISPTPEVRALTPPRCEWVAWLDSSGDGKISGADRYWRHLYLWVDDDGNRIAAQREVKRLLDYDIRSIDLALRTYTKRKEVVGDISVSQNARFRLIGSRRSQPDRAILVIDTDGLRRAGPVLRFDGESATGLQPLRPGMELDRSRDASAPADTRDGEISLTCTSGRP